MMNGTQLDSIGQLLSNTREQKGISIEQAAREMRVKAERIEEMESDDISHFTHPSYARFFMRDYAQYLGLSAEAFSEHLPEAGSSISDGLDYLQYFNQVEVATRTDIIRSGRATPSRAQVASRRAAGLGWVVFCLFAAGAVAGLFYLKDYFRPGDSQSQEAAVAVGTETPVPASESEQSAVEAEEAAADSEQNAARPEADFSGDRAFLLTPEIPEEESQRVALDNSGPISLQQQSGSASAGSSSLQQPIELQ